MAKCEKHGVRYYKEYGEACPKCEALLAPGYASATHCTVEAAANKLGLKAIKENMKCYVKPYYADDGCGFIWDNEDMHVLDTRGWGFLTGGGALGLPGDDAAIIQDSFQQHVVDALNAYKDFDPMESLRVAKEEGEIG